MPILEVINIEKWFGAHEVLKKIDFSPEKGETLAIIGSSGSGKTTLLRCLNFLKSPIEGKIIVNGKVILTRQTLPPSAKAKCGRSACISAWSSRTSICSPSTQC